MSTPARRARFVLPAFLFAALLAVGTVVPARSAAAADTPVTWYVNNNVSCSDSSPGTKAEPFCDVAAGLAAAGAGDTVAVTGTHAENVVMTKSGEPGRPITVTGDVGTFGVTGLALDGVHDVAVRRASVRPASADVDGLSISGSSAITTENVSVYAPTGVVGSGHGARLSGVRDSALTALLVVGGFQTGVSLDAETTGVTLARVRVVDQVKAHTDGTLIEIAGDRDTVSSGAIGPSYGTGIRVTPEAAETTLTRNTFTGFPPVAVSDAGQGTMVAGNTLAGCVTLDAQSRNASIENNILTVTASTGCGGAFVMADPAATASATVDYNSISRSLLYAWGGTSFTSVAEFQAATGQGAHDLFDATAIRSRDNANAAAPGWSEVDAAAHRPQDDPNTIDTGSGPVQYADRGATEAVRAPNVSLDVDVRADGLTTALSARLGTAWAPIVSYVFDFGDGTVISGSDWQATHTYARAGTYSVTLKVTDASNVSFQTPVQTIHPGATYMPLRPTRLLDTRTYQPGVLVYDDGSHVRTIRVDTGPTTYPTAVVLNVTMVNPLAAGYLTAYADGAVRPPVSNLNWAPGQTVANTVVVPVTDGKVSFYSSLNTGDLVVDLIGYQSRNPGLLLRPAGPLRVLDTRDRGDITGGARIHSGNMTLVSLPSVPSALCRAAAVNVTVTGGTGPGFVTLYNWDDGTVPATSTINWNTGQTVANMTVTSIGTGRLGVYVGGRFAVHVILDVSGWFCPDEAGIGSTYHAVAPVRALDTRSHIGVATTIPVRAGGTVGITLPGVPADATAVVLNVTVTQPKLDGFATAYAYGTVRPNASSVNYAAGQTVPNLVIVPVIDGRATLYTLREAHLIADVFGYYAK